MVLLCLVASCSYDDTVTLSSAGSEILVARDKAVMESMVDCAIEGRCSGVRVMELLPSGQAFVVKAGTKVSTRVGFFPSSGIRRVVILDGFHRGREGWVYERLLYADPRDASLQRAFEDIRLAAKTGAPGG
jgi:hypothetical protein